MNPTILIVGSAIFYILLLSGAIVRVRKRRSLHSLMQLFGVIAPVVPAGIFLFRFKIAEQGFSPAISNALLIVYGVTWITMALGYLLEGLDDKEQE